MIYSQVSRFSFSLGWLNINSWVEFSFRSSSNTVLMMEIKLGWFGFWGCLVNLFIGLTDGFGLLQASLKSQSPPLLFSKRFCLCGKFFSFKRTSQFPSMIFLPFQSFCLCFKIIYRNIFSFQNSKLGKQQSNYLFFMTKAIKAFVKLYKKDKMKSIGITFDRR